MSTSRGALWVGLVLELELRCARGGGRRAGRDHVFTLSFLVVALPLGLGDVSCSGTSIVQAVSDSGYTKQAGYISTRCQGGVRR